MASSKNRIEKLLIQARGVVTTVFRLPSGGAIEVLNCQITTKV